MVFYMPSESEPFCIINPFQNTEENSPLCNIQQNEDDLPLPYGVSEIFHHVKNSSTRQLIAIHLTNILKNADIPLKGHVTCVFSVKTLMKCINNNIITIINKNRIIIHYT